MLDETISSVRSISRDLMPSTLEKFGLSKALDELCSRFSNTSGVTIQFTEKGSVSEVSAEHGILVLRIVQELINNALKHANATTINVKYIWGDNPEFFVEDDGRGFDRSTIKEGLGLFTIENRARLLGGRVDYQSSTSGSKISVSIIK
jgi:signal transduction histidine kinase